ncbi:MAG: hypothetical protein ACI82H_001375 [Alphaproteobacteria bacterium]|jgi:hypothetical protein
MSSVTISDDLAQGAANCVLDCGGVQAGQSLYVVNETGAVEQEVVDAIAATGVGAGAEVSIVWAPPIPKDTRDAIPPDVLAAYRGADVLISHYPSLKREALVAHFGSETRVRVPNRARTADLLGSDWARFPYGLQRVIASRLDGLMAPGQNWRVTTPAGTDVAGTFGAAGGAVGDAFFVDTDDGRARRNFPGGVHAPRSCGALDGVIVCEYLDGVDMAASDAPLVIRLADGRVRDVQGGDVAGQMRATVTASDGHIDSWHAGVHPRTRVPISRGQNARQWFSYSHCSPDILHFHLGRSHETTNVAVFGQTLDVAGQLLYDAGQLVIADGEIAAAIAAAGMQPDMFLSRDIGRW